jgi:hypothetical protein
MLFIIVVGCILGLSFQQHLLCEAKIALVQEQLLAMQKQNADLQNQVGHLTRVISKTNIAEGIQFIKPRGYYSGYGYYGFKRVFAEPPSWVVFCDI